VVGLAKASPTLIFDAFAEKCIDVSLRKRVTGALKIFWATQQYLQSVLPLAPLGAREVAYAKFRPSAGMSLPHALRPILSHLDVILAGMSR
jgi:hypothetical protein